MWYEGHPGKVLLCTAFSKDGLAWTKPNLGIQEWRGSKDNNIILQTGYLDANCASIVKAPTEKDPARRYKLYYWVAPEWFESHAKAFGWREGDPALAAVKRVAASTTQYTTDPQVLFAVRDRVARAVEGLKEVK